MTNGLRLGMLGGANIARQFKGDVKPNDYEAMLANPEINAVYIPLPNSLHAQWAIKAAEHGKRILCEKPLALNCAEAESMFDAADKHDVMLLEAFPYYFQPQTAAMMTLIGEGAIGSVRSMQASFGFTVGKPGTNIPPEAGTGRRRAARCRQLHAELHSPRDLVMGTAPQSVQAVATWADSNVDISLMATLLYADGRHAQFSCAIDGANHRMATIVGTDGTIDTEFLNHTSDEAKGDAYGYLPSQLRVRRGIANTIPFEQVESQTGSGFFFAAESFARMVKSHDEAAIAYYAQTSLDNAATLSAIIESARRGRLVAL